MHLKLRRARNTAHLLKRLTLAAACILAVTSACHRKASQPEPPPPSVQQLQQQITALEFVNQLRLQPDQIKKLADVLQPVRQAVHQRRSTQHQLIPLLQNKRNALANGKPVSADVSARIAQLQQQLTSLQETQALGDRDTARRVRSILADDQLQLALSSEQAGTQTEQMLAWFRTMSAAAFEDEVTSACEELTSTSSDMSGEQLEALLREVRTLNDQEYAQHKNDLVAKLRVLFAPTDESVDWLVMEKFVDPFVLDLIAKRARNLDRGA